MTYRELMQLLPQGELPNAMLWHGEEEFIKEEALLRLRARFLPEGLEALNENVLEGAVRPDAIISACETVPMMAERRLVLWRDPAVICASRPVEDDVRKIAEYLTQLPSHTLLLLYVRGQADGRRKLVQTLERMGAAAAFTSLAEEEACLWLISRAQSRGKALPQDVADAMVYRVGVSLSTLDSELEKLLAYAGERAALSTDDVNAIVSRSSQSSVFDMIDRLLEGRKETVYRQERELLLAGESRVRILSLITRAVRLSCDARILMDSGRNTVDIASALKLSRYATEQTLSKSRRRSAEWWRSRLSTCLAAEADIRQGNMRDEFALAVVLESLYTA